MLNYEYKSKADEGLLYRVSESEGFNFSERLFLPLRKSKVGAAESGTGWLPRPSKLLARMNAIGLTKTGQGRCRKLEQLERIEGNQQEDETKTLSLSNLEV